MRVFLLGGIFGAVVLATAWLVLGSTAAPAAAQGSSDPPAGFFESVWEEDAPTNIDCPLSGCAEWALDDWWASIGDDLGATAVFRWANDQQRWQSWRPGVPRGLNQFQGLAKGLIYWFFIPDEQVAPTPQPEPEAEPEPVVEPNPPVDVRTLSFGENSIGTNIARWRVTSQSLTRRLEALDLRYCAWNSFDEPVYDFGFGSQCGTALYQPDRAMAPGARATIELTLFGYDTAARVTTTIVRVLFSNGDVWRPWRSRGAGDRGGGLGEVGGELPDDLPGLLQAVGGVPGEAGPGDVLLDVDAVAAATAGDGHPWRFGSNVDSNARDRARTAATGHGQEGQRTGPERPSANLCEQRGSDFKTVAFNHSATPPQL